METANGYTGSRRHFSKTQKDQILREHTEQGVPIAQLARKNGINAVTVYQWKRNMNQDDESIIIWAMTVLMANSGSLS